MPVIVGGSALLALGFVVGLSVGHARQRSGRSGAPMTAAHADGTGVGIDGADYSGAVAGRRITAAEAVPPIRAFVPDAGVHPERVQVLQRADRLVELLNHRVRTFPPPEANADGVEGVANATDEYLRGWADSLEAGAPELLQDTARGIERDLCEGDLSDAQTVVYLRFVLREAATRGPVLDRGLRCVLGRRTQEDIVLWTALDAWAKSDLAAAPEWTAWAGRATDPRTLRRLVPWSRRGEGRE